MSDRETRLSRRDAERLLDDPAATSSALGTTLSAAAAPGQPGELAREDATVAAFRSARLTPPPVKSDHFVSPNRLGSRAATHALVATAAVVALASGSFALSGSLQLPGLPGHRAGGQTSESLASSGTSFATTDQSPPGTLGSGGTSGTGGSQGSGTGTSSPTRGGSPGTSTEGPGTTGTTDPTSSPTSSHTPTNTPSPNLAGLCKAYQATDRSDAGKSLDSAAFAALVQAAGGKAGVEAFCISLVGAPDKGGKGDKGNNGNGQGSGQGNNNGTTGNGQGSDNGNKPTDKPSPTKPSPTRTSPTNKPSPTTTPTSTTAPSATSTATPTPGNNGNANGSNNGNGGKGDTP